MRRATVLLAGLLTVLALASGCFLAVDALAIEHHERTQTFAAVPTVGLDVHGAGTVRVVGDGGDTVRVDFRWRESLKPPRVEARLVDDRLVIHTACGPMLDTFCSVSATVHVPVGTAVDGGGDSPIEVIDVAGAVALTATNGSVRVQGADGPVRIEADNGTVRVIDSTGDLFLRADNGAVRTERVRADVVEADSRNGRVELDLERAPTQVRARSDNGSVTVLVPDDGQPYATTVSSGNGSTDAPVLTSPTAGRSIEARSTNGSVSIRYRATG